MENVMLMHIPGLAWKVYEGCIRSVSSKTLANEVFSAHTVLESIMTMLPEIDLGINKEEKVKFLGLSCKVTLEELDVLLKQEANARTVDDQLAGTRINEMERLRNQLMFQINMLDTFYSNAVLR